MSCVHVACVHTGAEIFTKRAAVIAGLQASVEESYREAELLRAALAQATQQLADANARHDREEVREGGSRLALSLLCLPRSL